jgi:hypothetical protein
MGNPVIIDMMAREKMRELQAERKRPVPDQDREILPGKILIIIFYAIMNSAIRRVV